MDKLKKCLLVALLFCVCKFTHAQDTAIYVSHSQYDIRFDDKDTIERSDEIVILLYKMIEQRYITVMEKSSQKLLWVIQPLKMDSAFGALYITFKYMDIASSYEGKLCLVTKNEEIISLGIRDAQKISVYDIDERRK